MMPPPWLRSLLHEAARVSDGLKDSGMHGPHCLCRETGTDPAQVHSSG